MASIVLTLTSGRQVEFEVDTGREGPAYFVLSLARSGSTLLNKIVEQLARANGRRFVEVGDTFFRANVDTEEFEVDPALERLVQAENVYGGFRSLPLALAWSPRFETGRKVILVRDPRDALVSLYYSDSLSHPIPDVTDGFDDVVQVMNERRAWARSMTIDEYVVDRAPRTARVLMGYLPLLRSSTVRCFRYEEFIFEKEALMAGISEHFGWEVDAETTARLMTEVDVIPDTEDPSRFIRQVNPGNYLSKLRPDTIATLNRMLKTSMGPYGYAP